MGKHALACTMKLATNEIGGNMDRHESRISNLENRESRIIFH
jgi:hypothetical protein